MGLATSLLVEAMGAVPAEPCQRWMVVVPPRLTLLLPILVCDAPVRAVSHLNRQRGIDPAWQCSPLQLTEMAVSEMLIIASDRDLRLISLDWFKFTIGLSLRFGKYDGRSIARTQFPKWQLRLSRFLKSTFRSFDTHKLWSIELFKRIPLQPHSFEGRYLKVDT